MRRACSRPGSRSRAASARATAFLCSRLSRRAAKASRGIGSEGSAGRCSRALKPRMKQACSREARRLCAPARAFSRSAATAAPRVSRRASPGKAVRTGRTISCTSTSQLRAAPRLRASVRICATAASKAPGGSAGRKLRRAERSRRSATRIWWMNSGSSCVAPSSFHCNCAMQAAAMAQNACHGVCPARRGEAPAFTGRGGSPPCSRKPRSALDRISGRRGSAWASARAASNRAAGSPCSNSSSISQISSRAAPAPIQPRSSATSMEPAPLTRRQVRRAKTVSNTGARRERTLSRSSRLRAFGSVTAEKSNCPS